MRISRIHPHKRNYVNATVTKEVTHVDFIAKPLQESCYQWVQQKQRLQLTAITWSMSNDT